MKRIAIFAIILLAFAVPARAENLHDCPGQAATVTIPSDDWWMTIHRPHVFERVEWIDPPDGALIGGLGTDTLEILYGEGKRINVYTVCVWRVFIPLVER